MSTDAISVRVAAAEDLPALVALDPLATGQRAARVARAVEEGRCVVASLGPATAGYAVTRGDWFGFPFLELVVVAGEHRRRGVGGALVRRCLRAAGGVRLFTSTNQSNAPMRRLLEREGFVPSGRVENLDEGDPELIYVALPPP